VVLSSLVAVAVFHIGSFLGWWILGETLLGVSPSSRPLSLDCRS
jgi:hypothetical protein